MEDNQPLEPEVVSGNNCVNCGQPALADDHPTALCQECRHHFVQLRIPLWIKLFAGGIGLILLFSLFTFPKNVGLGIRLRKGKEAIGKRNYTTAEKELKKALEGVPTNVDAEGNLLVAAFYNQDFETLSMEYKKLEHVNIEDKELYTAMSVALDKAAKYLPNDSFNLFMQKHPDNMRIGDTAWERYLGHNPEDPYALARYASTLLDNKHAHRADSVLLLALKVDEGYFPALALETSVQRELGDYDKSIEYADRMIALNRESAYGMSTKARTMLRQKKDQPALALAKKAFDTDPDKAFVEGTLILAYHFNGKATDRDALMKKAFADAKDSADKVNVQYVKDVMDQKEKFRD